MRLSSSSDEFKLRRAAAFAVVFCASLPSSNSRYHRHHAKVFTIFTPTPSPPRPIVCSGFIEALMYRSHPSVTNDGHSQCFVRV